MVCSTSAASAGRPETPTRPTPVVPKYPYSPSSASVSRAWATAGSSSMPRSDPLGDPEGVRVAALAFDLLVDDPGLLEVVRRHRRAGPDEPVTEARGPAQGVRMAAAQPDRRIGLLLGLGLHGEAPACQNRPSTSNRSCVHAACMRRRPSVKRPTNASRSIPNAPNAPETAAGPQPESRRPPLTWSRVATVLARCSGLARVLT